MRRKLLLLSAGIALCLLCGCSQEIAAPGTKKQVSSFIKKEAAVKLPVELYLKNENANIEIFTWNEDAVRFEVTKKVRGINPESVLREYLDKLHVEILVEGNKASVESYYDGNAGSLADRLVDMIIYVPQKIRFIEYNVKAGRITIHDDISCDIAGRSELTNVEIKKFTGKLDINGDMGNFTVQGGHIKTGSAVIENMGNIEIRASFDDDGEYSFVTGLGNINLFLPSGKKINVNSSGNIKTNEFITNESDMSYENAANFKVASDLGEISIRKY